MEIDKLQQDKSLHSHWHNAAFQKLDDNEVFLFCLNQTIKKKITFMSLFDFWIHKMFASTHVHKCELMIYYR